LAGSKGTANPWQDDAERASVSAKEGIINDQSALTATGGAAQRNDLLALFAEAVRAVSADAAMPPAIPV